MPPENPEVLITLRKHYFVLSASDLLRDSPSCLTVLLSTCAKTSPNSSNYSLYLDRFEFNPIIFQIVVDYLHGEPIFPLPEILAGTKSREVVMISLKRYAKDLELKGLMKALEDETVRLEENKINRAEERAKPKGKSALLIDISTY